MDGIEEKILNEILKTTYTADSFKKRFQAMRMMLSGQIYSGGREEKKEDEDAQSHIEHGKKETSSEAKAQKWLKGFDKNLLDGITSSQFSAMSEHIDHYISTLNPLTIYFVFLPDEDQVAEMGGWLRKSMNNPRLIFNVKVDPNLIGGCAIVYKGVYKDYSLRAKISANKEKLIEEFRKYFKQ